MSRRKQYPHAWLSALIALFMVLVLPACWYGALARLGPGSSSSNSNNEEERHEHDSRGSVELEARGKRPPQRANPDRIAEVRLVPAAVPRSQAIVDSVAPPLEPSRFSVRRLI